VKLLLDTHAALWWLADDARLAPDAELQLSDETNAVLLSVC
jgi:PIN domain nuclease of toxin-antitoxin system